MKEDEFNAQAVVNLSNIIREMTALNQLEYKQWISRREEARARISILTAAINKAHEYLSENNIEKAYKILDRVKVEVIGE